MEPGLREKIVCMER
jgi:hypothetical protein